MTPEEANRWNVSAKAAKLSQHDHIMIVRLYTVIILVCNCYDDISYSTAHSEQDFIICMEMVGFALLNYKAFSYQGTLQIISATE